MGALDPQAGGELPTEAASSRRNCSALGGGAKSLGRVPIAYGIRNNRINFWHPEMFGIATRALIVNLSAGTLDPQAGCELATEAAGPRPDCSALGGGAKSVAWWPTAYGFRNSRFNFQHPEIFRTESSRLDCELIGGGARSAGWWRITYGSCEPEVRLLSFRCGR